MTNTKQTRVPAIMWFFIIVGGLLAILALILPFFEESFDPPVSAPILAPQAHPLPLLPDRPQSPELDYAAECVWLTNNVLGPVGSSKERRQFIATCLEDANSAYCTDKAKDLFGEPTGKIRVEFFYKCLNVIASSIEASCCYDAWDCRTDLHSIENALKDLQEKCETVCDKTHKANDSYCYMLCRY